MNERIAQIIKQLNIKKVEFARRLNISQAFVSDLCSGKSAPSDRTIADICREYGVDETWLRTGAGEMFRQKSQQDEIMDYIGRIITGEPNEFQRRLVVLMSQIPAEYWPVLEEKSREILLHENEKEE